MNHSELIIQNDLFKTNDFQIKLKRLKSKVYLSSIEENVEISKLYSNYAIDTAYNTGVIAEDKIYLLYINLLYNIFKSQNNQLIFFNLLIFFKCISFISTVILFHIKST